MSRTIIATEAAAAAVGPYSQGVGFDRLVFASGQLPIDPASGELAEGIEAQTKAVLRNLEAVLIAGGASFATVLKTTVFLKNMDDFAAMNAVYATAFPAEPPARSTIEVAKLPKGALVEIEAVAARQG